MSSLQSDIMIELHVPDFGTVKGFYSSLGYEVVWEKEDYLVMRSGASILNFYSGSEKVYEHSYFKNFPKDTPRGYAVEIIIPVDSIEIFYEKFMRSHPEQIVGELAQRHSHRDFRATDPYGFYLRFVERYNWLDGRDKHGVPLE